MSTAPFIASEGVWVVSALAIGTFFVLYPAGVWLFSRLAGRGRRVVGRGTPTVSLLVVVRNAETFIEEKVRNSLDLDYPASSLDLVFCSDGSDDGTEGIIRRFEGERLRLIPLAGHQGKIAALNRAIYDCTGDIVVLSDADAMLDPDAIRKLVRHFDDPTVGGVCGQRIIARDGAELREAQSRYIGFDSRIKQWESRLGSITSNDGKIYAIRRDLFCPLAPAVSDDLYLALGVVRQHRRFTFEPEARARIRLPSRSPAHEIERRRRIVSQSYRSMWFMRQVLNPFEHGPFALALAVNKILRRLLPFFFVTLVASTLILSFRRPWMVPLLGAQAGVLALAAYHGWTGGSRGPRSIRRLAAVAFYFVLGQWGTLLGVIDFATGRQVNKWDPVKTDRQACSRS